MIFWIKLPRIAAIFFAVLFFSLPAFAQDEDNVAYALTNNQKADSFFFDAVKAKMQDDKKRAQESFLAYTRQNPKGAAAWYELSKLYLGDKRVEPAESAIKKAMDIDNTNKWYRSQYALVLEYKNEPRDAADILMKVAKAERYNVELLYRAANLYKRAKRYKDALEALDMLIDQDDEEEIYQLEKVDVYLKQNDLDGAVRIVESLIAGNPMEGRYYVFLAKLYEDNNEQHKASEVYKRAQNIVPDDPVLQHALAMRSFETNDTTAFNDNIKKLALNKSLEVDEQLKILDDYVRFYGRDSSKRAEALGIAGELARQHPKNAQVAYTYGRVLIINDQLPRAINEFKRSLEIDQSNTTVWEDLIRSYAEKEKADSMNYYADKALRIFPNNAIMHFYKGIALMNKGDNDAAIKTLNRSVEMFPEDNTAALSQVHALLGDLYNTTKNYKISDENYRKALSLDPNNPSHKNNFAYYLSVRGENLEEAEKLSRETLQLAPEEATFLDTYGWILYKQGKYSKAKDYIQKAIDKSLEKADGTLHDHLGDVLFKLNDRTGALENWKKAKEKGVENPLIDKKIQEQTLYE
jgi:tetratricopeptide (TPR) repeat protein